MKAKRKKINVVRRKEPKIAIVHDSIQYFGGAERVLVTLRKLYPDADMFTSVISWENIGKFKKSIESLRIKTFWLQNIFLFRKYPYLFRYMLPVLWRTIDLSSYDIVISSSGAQMSHLIRVPKTCLHVCYCFTPPRHLFGYTTDFDWEKYRGIKKMIFIGNYLLRYINKHSLRTVDHFIACSKEVSGRIRRFYQRESTVIYPPVTLLAPPRKRCLGQEYYLVVSRLSRMKHIDQIIIAANVMNINLHIVGVGPEEKKLKQISGKTIRFEGQLEDISLAQKYQNAKALICCAQDEDFGITPVESLLYGVPVIAYFSGGYKETIQNHITGVYFTEPTADAIVSAVKSFNAESFSRDICMRSAKKFSEKIFKKKIQSHIHSWWRKKIDGTSEIKRAAISDI
jgi:glycosyltransferase involved in cell wall biosynthesis